MPLSPPEELSCVPSEENVNAQIPEWKCASALWPVPPHVILFVSKRHYKIVL